jgi:ankyrin repeat protein
MRAAEPFDETLSSGATYKGTLVQEENKLQISYIFGDACEIPSSVRDTRTELGFGLAKDCRRGRVIIPSLDLSEDVILTIDESGSFTRVLLQAPAAPELGLTVLRWEKTADGARLYGGDETWDLSDEPIIRTRLRPSVAEASASVDETKATQDTRMDGSDGLDVSSVDVARLKSERASTGPLGPLGRSTDDMGHIAAAARGKVDVLDRLLLSGAHINDFDESGETALIAASTRGRVDAVELLIKRRADLEASDAFGTAALAHAVLKHKVPVVRVLLRARASVSARDKDGRTPFHYAGLGPKAELVTLLLDAKARVDARDTAEQRTALMLASRNGRQENVRVLLDAGAATDVLDADGWPALVHAAVGNRPEVCRMLSRAGASRDLKVGEVLLKDFVKSLDAPDCTEVFDEWAAEDAAAEEDRVARLDPRYGRKAFIDEI